MGSAETRNTSGRVWWPVRSKSNSARTISIGPQERLFTRLDTMDGLRAWRDLALDGQRELDFRFPALRAHCAGLDRHGGLEQQFYSCPRPEARRDLLDSR